MVLKKGGRLNDGKDRFSSVLAALWFSIWLRHHDTHYLNTVFLRILSKMCTTALGCGPRLVWIINNSIAFKVKHFLDSLQGNQKESAVLLFTWRRHSIQELCVMLSRLSWIFFRGSQMTFASTCFTFTVIWNVISSWIWRTEHCVCYLSTPDCWLWCLVVCATCVPHVLLIRSLGRKTKPAHVSGYYFQGNFATKHCCRFSSPTVASRTFIFFHSSQTGPVFPVYRLFFTLHYR